ncbi:hypothetical protein HMPREF1624_01502 [Sporothrix schenckii ATCC 58251]|uniref:PLD phosphodiesterase domain-containing protein n=1 Tax=Sporothrix schenckii (strain ATCC 58251 / de Perez 2211183) TaxID=1391915 RepID=U7Q7L0_SPOS1|nr:hypothetical protein HMPREF1624_01502 [Sporothrix schenckii ATCC 58251]
METKDFGILKKGTLGNGIVELCTSKNSVSSLVAADPTLAAGDAWQTLYGKYSHTKDASDKAATSQVDDLQRAAQCGKWGPTQPSELFLKIYRDVLAVVEESPDRAMVSPSLLGSCGVAPLTVISTIPDIARHMANVIARAEKEVFLATNYWQDSVASRYITNAMRELDRRAGARGERVVFKVMYDRGSPKQLVDPHYLVGVEEYTGKNVMIPSSEEIPNIDMQVMNYHQAMVGTFHAKYMVVDRKIAILQSNNIQDNDNLEMMAHYEGPIVDSFYDMALMSWHKKMEPPLPSYNSPAAAGGLSINGAAPGQANITLPANASTEPPPVARQQPQTTPDAVQAGPIVDARGVREPGALDAKAAYAPVESDDVHRSDIVTGPTTTASTLHPHASKTSGGSSLANPEMDKAAAAQIKEGNTGSAEGTQDVIKFSPNKPNGPDPATISFLSSGKQPISAASIHQPTAPDTLLPQSTNEHPQYDRDIAGEVTRVQTSVSAKPGETQMEAISRLLNHTVNHLKADAPEPSEGEEMTPYIPHATHEPFPIAMVNRPPFGPPTHSSVVQPQNAAWLSALKNARKNVFIQTPTLNAEPLVPAIYEACERGLDVILYVCLGYNDMGELLPRQGGTNEMIAHQLYQALSETGRQHLHYFWYVAKDQTRPIPQSKKKRDCHIKLMIVDETIGIMGNGNQDTQSWYHSQEINVMLESPDVCHAWIDALRRNENTHLYGGLDKKEGVWRDHEGKEADGVLGIDPGRFSWAKGFVGAIKRVQGKGGF